jgi:hypothetical protein
MFESIGAACRICFSRPLPHHGSDGDAGLDRNRHRRLRHSRPSHAALAAASGGHRRSGLLAAQPSSGRRRLLEADRKHWSPVNIRAHQTLPGAP